MVLRDLGSIINVLNAALGKEPPDLVIEGGNIVNVYTGEVYRSDVLIKGSYIAKVGKFKGGPSGVKVINASGKFVVPGFIDGHIHIESSLLSIPRFAEAVLPHGTTSVVTDLHEIGIVLGLRGIRFMLDIARKTPLKVFLMVPSHIPFMPGLETVGSEFGVKEIEEALGWDESVALSEVVAAQLLGLHEELLKSIELTFRMRKLVEGHGPALTGGVLQAFATAGIASDHESVSCEEGLEKLRLGIELMVREGSVATNLSEVIKVVTQRHVDVSKVMLVSDDVSCIDLVTLGHMDYKVRRAVEEGVDPVKAIQMVTINTAKHFRIDDVVGSIAPGRIADLVIVNNLRDLTIDTVVASGEVVFSGGRLTTSIPEPEYPEEFLKTIRVKRRVLPEDFKVRIPVRDGIARVRVIGVRDGTLLKDALVDELKVVNGEVVPDVAKDVLKVAVIERHKATGNVGIGFVKGFGIKEGALGTTIAHDHHNITVIAVNDEDAALATNTLIDLSGGIAVVRNGEVLSKIKLPIAGLLSHEPPHKVKEEMKAIYSSIRDLGCKLRDPIIHLSFITATAIPAYGISDKGLIDVMERKVVDIVVEYRD
ncbi:MAG: adenine deaminase [Desulfurococcales archaeon ex4484_204]|nr:MAG: adenine deaminase [Desulfurococcales archaeon ex4484_204]